MPMWGRLEKERRLPKGTCSTNSRRRLSVCFSKAGLYSGSRVILGASEPSGLLFMLSARGAPRPRVWWWGEVGGHSYSGPFFSHIYPAAFTPFSSLNNANAPPPRKQNTWSRADRTWPKICLRAVSGERHRKESTIPPPASTCSAVLTTCLSPFPIHDATHSPRFELLRTVGAVKAISKKTATGNGVLLLR